MMVSFFSTLCLFWLTSVLLLGIFGTPTATFVGLMLHLISWCSLCWLLRWVVLLSSVCWLALLYLRQWFSWCMMFLVSSSWGLWCCWSWNYSSPSLFMISPPMLGLFCPVVRVCLRTTYRVFTFLIKYDSFSRLFGWFSRLSSLGVSFIPSPLLTCLLFNLGQSGFRYLGLGSLR